MNKSFVRSKHIQRRIIQILLTVPATRMTQGCDSILFLWAVHGYSGRHSEIWPQLQVSTPISCMLFKNLNFLQLFDTSNLS